MENIIKAPVTSVEISVNFRVFYERGDKEMATDFTVQSPHELMALTEILLRLTITKERFKELGHPLAGARVFGFNMTVQDHNWAASKKAANHDDEKQAIVSI